MNGTPSPSSPGWPPPGEEAPHAAFESILYGRFGLRAGWSLLLYFALIASVALPVQIHQQHRREHMRATHANTTTTVPAPQTPAAPRNSARGTGASPHVEPVEPVLLSEATVFGGILLLSLLMAWIERRRVSAYGLGGATPLRRFATGAFWGVTALSLLVGLLRALHLLSFDARLDHGAAIFGWGFALLVMFLLVGLTEEYLFRGYLQFTLRRGLVGLGDRLAPGRGSAIAFWLAAVLTSALFFLAHIGNSGENRVGLALVFLAGLLFLVALWRTGSLWWAIGFHTTWDWSQSFLYGVPDSGGLIQGRLFATHASGNPLLSGGSAGPEGSLLAIPVIVLVILVLLFATHPSPQPPLEPREQQPASPEPALRLGLGASERAEP